MIENKFNDSWKFWIEKNSFALVWDIPQGARDITLPHDGMLETNARPDSNNKGNTGYRDGEIYNYIKLFHAPKEYRNKTVILKFEGIYMNSFVYVNGELAGKCPYGYSTFYVQINDFLKYGEENEIRIIVRNGAMTNSRWYSGGGIYRDVYLLVSDLTYMVPDGIHVITEVIEEDHAVVSISTELKNRYHAPMELKLNTTLMDVEENIISSETFPVVLFEAEERKINQRIVVEKPRLWSEDTPNLYICSSKLYKDGEMIDESRTVFGIRILQLDAKRGFRVNGHTVNLRGACIHHDSGLLGAATYYDAQYRQIKILKEAGFNGIRMSHHPMAPAMLRACDELGMYVMDEAFDMWTRSKSDYDYGMNFQEWWEKDVEAMVRKDRNHPCVIMYSLGNEIPEIGTNHGVQICHRMSEKIKSLDNTRYTLASINGIFAAGDSVGKIMSDVVSELNEQGYMEGNVNNFMTLLDKHLDKIVVHEEITKRLDKACGATDIAGYNYMTARYEADGINYPNRIIVGSETYPPEIARNWEIVERCSHVIGDFTWTGWDYIGEAGVGVPAYNWGEGGFGAVYPCQLAYCGDIDITGFRRPASYYREIVFGLRKNPYITVWNPYHYGENIIKTPWVMSDSISSWTWKNCEDKPIIVEIYSPGNEVELFCNGKLIDRKETGLTVGFRTLFETTYHQGTLTAISYMNSTEIGRMELSTSQNERKIVLMPEEKDNELIYVPIVISDSKGNIATDGDTKLDIAVEGGADLIGFGSGNPKSTYNYIESVTETFNGRALAILKRNGSTGKINIKVCSDKYQEQRITL